MQIAVITPFHQTPTALLEKCLASVAQQTTASTHFLVCDGDQPDQIAMPAAVQVLRLPRPHQDFGNAARAIGSISAICQGCEAIAYLDADNWYEPDHLQLLCEAHNRTGAAVCTSGRTLYDLNGERLGVCQEVDGDTFVDTNCLFLTRRAFGVVAAWYMMPRSRVEVGDRIVWKAIKDAKLNRAHLERPTVNYRTRHRAHYLRFGKQPPPGTKHITVTVRLPAQTDELRPAPTPSQNRLLACPHNLLSQGARENNRRSSPSIPARLTSHCSPPTVSLCMIVRNEESTLATCLRSVGDLVSETIVVDTGSTDRTKVVARQCGAKVFEFPWVDDFAAARNQSLRHAKGQWIFWLDADEFFDEENRKRLRNIFGGLGDDNCVYMMKQWSVADQVNGSAMVVDHARLFRKQPGVGWRFRIHEQILPALQEAGAKVVFTDIVLRHFGYQNPACRKQKLERNLHLLLIEHQERPDEAFTLFNLGGTYLDAGDVGTAMPYIQKCIEHAPKGASFLAKAYVLLAQIQRSLGHVENGLGYCREGKALFPKDVELWFEEGLLLQAKKDSASAQRCFEHILNLPQLPCYVGLDAGLRGHLARHHLALALREQSRPSDAEAQWRAATTECPHFGPAWLGLAEVCLEQQRGGEVEKMIDRLSEEAQGKPIIAVLRARVCLSRGQHDAACRIMQDAIGQAPRFIWLRMLLSDMLIYDGQDLDEAQKQLNEILAIDPKQTRVRQRLQQIRQNRSSQNVGLPV
jgi:glycosyltransferase involved in cell wall biosynthesis